MKKSPGRTVHFVLAGMALLLAGGAEAARFKREVRMPVKHAFVPVGFDNDDRVEVMVTGRFPSTCYRLGRFETSVNDEKQIQISLIAYEFEGNCEKGTIPFHEVVSLGRLRSPGTYYLVDGVTKDPLGKLPIVEAPDVGHGTDEALYAPLTDAYVHQENGESFVRLVGAYPTNCMKMDKVKLDLRGTQLVVQPEVKVAKRDNCLDGNFPFTEDYVIKDELPHEAFLLHVRSISGASINKLVVLHP